MHACLTRSEFCTSSRRLDQRDGGPVRAIVDLSAASEEYGVESHLPDNPLPAGRIHITPPAVFHAFRYAPGLRRWLRRHVSQFDGVVIHGMWLYPGLAASLECLRAKVPYACFPHGMLDLYPVKRSGVVKHVKKYLYWRLVESWLFEGATAVLFTTNRELQNAGATFPIRNRKLIVVPYGILPRTRPVERPRTEALWQPPGRRVALFLGRVHPKKNVAFLVEAWNRARIAPDYHLVVAGLGHHAYLADVRPECKALSATNPHKTDMIGSE